MVNPLNNISATPAPAPTRAANSAAPADITISYNSQDEVVFGASPITVPNVTNKSGKLSVEKAELNEKLKANSDGTFVYESKNEPAYTGALTFAATAKTINAFSDAIGQPLKWAFSGDKLKINPDAGEDFNAYYSRDEASVNFFHGTDPKTSQVLYSGNSGEVVSHEVGHAMLDAIRPGYFESWTPDAGAFHEAFGDMMGMMMAFKDDRAVKQAAQQTGGDLTKQNCIAATGEQLGIGINDYVGQNATGGDYVRNAINSFKWVDPNTLPSNAPNDQLSSEVHSFSRLWSGAFYDIVAGVQARNMAAGMDAETALKATGDEMLKVLANGMKDAPQGDFTFRDMANAWVAADQKYNNGADADLMTKVFTDRGILGGTTPAPAPAPPSGGDGGNSGSTSRLSGITSYTSEGQKPLSDLTRTVYTRLSGPEFGMFQGAQVESVVDKDGSLTKDAEVGSRVKQNLARYIADGRIRYNDPSYKMKVPQDLFDAKGRPYIGFVRWDNGQMVIERAKVAN